MVLALAETRLYQLLQSFCLTDDVVGVVPAVLLVWELDRKAA